MYQIVARLSEIPEGRGLVVQCAGPTFALFRSGGKVYALDNACVHRGGPLGEGAIEDNCVTCPWHAWSFDLGTGDCKTSPGLKQKTYPVKIDKDDILVDF